MRQWQTAINPPFSSPGWTRPVPSPSPCRECAPAFHHFWSFAELTPVCQHLPSTAEPKTQHSSPDGTSPEVNRGQGSLPQTCWLRSCFLSPGCSWPSLYCLTFNVLSHAEHHKAPVTLIPQPVHASLSSRALQHANRLPSLEEPYHPLTQPESQNVLGWKEPLKGHLVQPPL